MRVSLDYGAMFVGSSCIVLVEALGGQFSGCAEDCMRSVWCWEMSEAIE